MTRISAQTVNTVNAYSGNSVNYSPFVSRKSELEPSAFWRRLVECWRAQDLPTSQNGVANKFGMRGNGTTGRWFRGEGLPEIDKIIRIAELGKVTIDWLLTGHPPKEPVNPKSTLGILLALWANLDEDAQSRVLRAAQGEEALRQAIGMAVREPRRKEALRRI